MNRPLTREHSEQGAALVLAIISLFLITGLATAMLTSARTESLIGTNEERAVHARMAAEAGLNHAVQVVADRLVDWRSVPFATPELAVTDLLNGPDNTAGNADDGSLTEYGLLAPGVRTTLSADEGTEYEVRVYDDDDTAAPRRLDPLGSLDLTRLGENGTTTSDANRRLVVHAVGYGPAGTTTRLEAVVGPLMMPALVTNADLTINGSVTVDGSEGSIHTNSNLIIDGGSADVAENCTASGTMDPDAASTCDGTVSGGRPTLTVPNVAAINYLDQAKFRLNDDGSIEWRNLLTDPFATVCTTNACAAGYGWEFTGASAVGAPKGWRVVSDPDFGAYYIEGNVTISGGYGSSGTPLQLTMLAEGYVDISGNPDIKPYLTELFIVTNMDLKINGNVGTAYVEGQVLVREQLSISGNADFAGQILVQDASNTCTLVTSNSISGSVHMTYNGIAGSSNFAVLSWREVR